MSRHTIAGVTIRREMQNQKCILNVGLRFLIAFITLILSCDSDDRLLLMDSRRPVAPMLCSSSLLDVDTFNAPTSVSAPCAGEFSTAFAWWTRLAATTSVPTDAPALPRLSNADPRNRSGPPVLNRASLRGGMQAVMTPRTMATKPGLFRVCIIAFVNSVMMPFNRLLASLPFCASSSGTTFSSIPSGTDAAVLLLLRRSWLSPSISIFTCSSSLSKVLSEGGLCGSVAESVASFFI
mmetsp:Transcript_22431/g.45182  ORF Transcript_22431/g.45182 Transcript_22431/m.45182 type:complete len:237 (+) Transcript_22431:324-1034(+)